MPSHTGRPADGRPPHAACVREAYARFLEAHAQAGRHGKPLLTAEGEAYLRRELDSGQTKPARDAGDAGGSAVPSWEAETRRLWLGDRLLKAFRQPAPYQGRLLSAFQDHAWSMTHVDDPLPLAAGETREDAKRRLHETVRNLNRGMPPGTIRFRGDGTGQGVTWEYDRRPADGTGG